ncbi:hypothetical protein [Paraburkholderia ribeironis]|nr:hypothetical protein [Paraburkholderia ribeironis]
MNLSSTSTAACDARCIARRHMHTPMPPEVDPDAPLPDSDPVRTPPDDPASDPSRPPDGDPPAKPPPVSGAGRELAQFGPH